MIGVIFKEVYEKYKIMPILQEHMVRVAYVAKTIADNATEKVDSDNIVKACLLHDMGNIIKFNLSVIENAVDDKGMQYWKSVKEEFINKYGSEEFSATKQICHELGVSVDVFALVNSFGTRNVPAIIKSTELNKMIVNYADHRVAPEGVVSLKERIEDQHNRFYKSFPHEEAEAKIRARKQTDDAKYDLEKAIFERSKLKPVDIKDVKVELLLPEFLNIEI